jgi:hypothetical protein
MTALLKLHFVSIGSGTSLSTALELGGRAVLSIEMPGAWDTANLTFQVSNDGATFANLYDEAGVEVAVTAAASRFIRLDPAKFAGIQQIKLRSGTAASPVNQSATRTLRLATRSLA